MAQHTLDMLRRHGIRPDTDLGQHFLVDDNVLDVAGRLAGLQPSDVAWEPGAGVGVLTRWLATRCAHVHAGEIDERLRDPLEEVAAAHANVQLHWGDAMDVDLAALAPRPTTLVSNLPYHVAAPIMAEALRHAPWITHGCVMVQREVADRFFAVERSRSYGATSVLVRAVCERTGMHRVSRSVFVPQPNVDSALVGFRRSGQLLRDEEVDGFARFVRGAFAHRRKTLANNLRSMDGAGAGEQPVERDRTVAALTDMGLGASARPEELAPEEFVALWREVRG